MEVYNVKLSYFHCVRPSKENSDRMNNFDIEAIVKIKLYNIYQCKAYYLSFKQILGKLLYLVQNGDINCQIKLFSLCEAFKRDL